MKTKIVLLLTALLLLILFLFLAFFNWDTGNNYMEELRQVSVYDRDFYDRDFCDRDRNGEEI